MGIKVYKTPYVYGNPIEYFLQSTNQTFAIGQIVKLGSTAPGLQYSDATTPLVMGQYITIKATTGSSVEMIPVHRISRDILYKVPHSTAEAVVGTSAQGYLCTISSSGAATVGTTGAFTILTVANTSDTTAQYFIGRFLGTTGTTG